MILLFDGSSRLGRGLNFGDKIHYGEVRVDIGVQELSTLADHEEVDNMSLWVQIGVDVLQVILTSQGVD